jgi:hypothetical protein
MSSALLRRGDDISVTDAVGTSTWHMLFVKLIVAPLVKKSVSLMEPSDLVHCLKHSTFESLSRNALVESTLLKIVL